MKYDFKDLAFIIHFRVDVPERLRNLQIVLDYYYDKCKNLEFIIVNDDAQPEKILKEIHKKYENIKILFYKNKSYHNKSLSFNSAFKQTDRKVIIAHDTDVIIDPEHILNGADKILKENVDHVYPYNGLFIWVKENLVTEFKNNLNIKTFVDKIPTKENIVNLYQNNYITVASTESCGGCAMYSSKIFKKINGYNPNFIGWGYEDDEINERVKKFKGKTERVSDDSAIAWHMPHPKSIREDNPHCKRNDDICTYVRSLNYEEIKDYIKGWKI